jgi:hypothetical protein
MSSGTHLKLCLINALLNTSTPLKGEEVRKKKKKKKEEEQEEVNCVV